jgi:hypothetical protein
MEPLHRQVKPLEIRSIWMLVRSSKALEPEWETRLDIQASTHEPVCIAQEGDGPPPAGSSARPRRHDTNT